MLDGDLKHGSRRGRVGGLVAAGVLVLAGLLAAAPAALANTTKSTNWAGYAIHHMGVSFRQVSASWTQPNATCSGGHQSYSAMWVGLGGYSPTSDALEQIGTEVDCSASGKVVSSAWYELVPAPSRGIAFDVQPGDALHASVTVTGHRVVVELDNLTRHHSYRRTVYGPSIDVSSAEWIVEAPSECISQYSCQALPLANFGSVSFGSATAVTTTGAAGPITGNGWSRTRIKLTAGAQRIVVARGSSDTNGTAAPSALRGGGSIFDVTYAAAPSHPGPAFARDARVRAGYIQH